MKHSSLAIDLTCNQRFVLWPSLQRRKVFVCTAVLVLLTSLDARAQVDPQRFDPILLSESPEALIGDLKVFREYAVGYRSLGDQGKSRWADRVSDPLAGAKIPIDRIVADNLFAILEDPKAKISPALRFEIDHEIMLALKYVVPGNPRLVEAAYTILTGELPRELRSIPEINLFAGCLNILIKTNDQQAVAFLDQAESAAFWRDRVDGVLLADSYEDHFVGHPKRALLLLRSLVARQKAFIRPAIAIPYIEGILARENEDPAYKEHLQVWLNMAQNTLTTEPDPDKQPIP